MHNDTSCCRSMHVNYVCLFQMSKKNRELNWGDVSLIKTTCIWIFIRLQKREKIVYVIEYLAVYSPIFTQRVMIACYLLCMNTCAKTKNYIKVMLTLILCYLIPLIREGSILTQKSIQLFSRLTLIYYL